MARDRSIDSNVKIAELYEEILTNMYVDQNREKKTMGDVILSGLIMNREIRSSETSLDARSKIIIAYTLANAFGCEFSAEVHRTALLKLGLHDTAISEISTVVKDQKEIIYVSKFLQAKMKNRNKQK